MSISGIMWTLDVNAASPFAPDPDIWSIKAVPWMYKSFHWWLELPKSQVVWFHSVAAREVSYPSGIKLELTNWFTTKCSTEPDTPDIVFAVTVPLQLTATDAVTL